MNVMRGQIVQVAKWGAWAVLEQRYNTAKYLNRTVGTKSNKISISMHLARKCYWLKWPGNSKSSLLLKYGPVVNACYCFTVVDVVPSGKIISQKMTAYLEEVGTKKRSGQKFIEWSQKDETRIFDSVSGRYMSPPILIYFNLKVWDTGFVFICARTKTGASFKTNTFLAR